MSFVGIIDSLKPSLSRETSAAQTASAGDGVPAEMADNNKTADPTSTGDTQREGEGGGEEEGPRETEEERRERVEGELAQLREELREAGSCVNLQPLGCDRLHRRYWLFPNLPGLYVEDLGLSSSSTPPTSISPPHPSTITHTPSDTTTHLPTSSDTQVPETTLTPHPTSPAGQSPPCQEGGGERDGVRWSCYSTEEEVDDLLAALDERGVREKALKQALALHKPVLLASLKKADMRSKLRPSPTSLQTYSSGNQYLELYLREQILDTEEKIHLGNLGHLRGAEGREEWRERIENSGAAAALSTVSEKKEEEGKEATPRQSSGSPSCRVIPSVQALSQALLEVEAGIELKFLMPPLGAAVDSKQSRLRSSSKKEVVKETDVCREQWRASLSQATSFSQIFVHLATLERAIMWSRSLMNVRCRICRRKGGDEYMLLCDGCDHGYHTYCLKPPLQLVPEGDWFCRDCCPITPVKPRKRTARVTFQEVGICLFVFCRNILHTTYRIHYNTIYVIPLTQSSAQCVCVCVCVCVRVCRLTGDRCQYGVDYLYSESLNIWM